MSRGSACYTVEVEEHEDTLRVYTTLDWGVGRRFGTSVITVMKQRGPHQAHDPA